MGRDRCLRAEGFRDPFRTVKAEENAKALALLPAVIGCVHVLGVFWDKVDPALHHGCQCTDPSSSAPLSMHAGASTPYWIRVSAWRRHYGVSLLATSSIWAPQRAASSSTLPAGYDPPAFISYSCATKCNVGCALRPFPGLQYDGHCSTNLAQRTQLSLLANSLPQVPFRQTVDGLVARPWAVDNLDAALDALTRPNPHIHAIAFVDNCGADAVLGIHSLLVAVNHLHVALSASTPLTTGQDLGCLLLAGVLPFARELLRRGTRISLAANETPSINDITAVELQQVQDSTLVMTAVLWHATGVASAAMQSTGR